MSYKKASIIVLSILIALGIAGCWLSIQIADSQSGISGSSNNFFGGPRFYPLLICALVVIFSIWALILVCRQKDDRIIEIHHKKNLLFVIAVVIIWAVLWQKVGQFYAVSFVAMAALLFFLNPEEQSAKKLLKSGGIALLVVSFVYAIFGAVLRIPL